MTLRIPAKVLLHVWSYDFYDMTLSTGKQRRHMINKIIFIFFFHKLICILFHAKTKWLSGQHLKPFRVKKWFKLCVRKNTQINDGVEASTRKSQARFQIIRVSSSAEHRMRLESENLPEIFLPRPQPHHIFL